MGFPAPHRSGSCCRKKRPSGSAFVEAPTLGFLTVIFGFKTTGAASSTCGSTGPTLNFNNLLSASLSNFTTGQVLSPSGC